MSQCHKVTLSQIHLVVSSLIRTFAASSSNTVFLWIHVLDLCVLLKIALFVRMDVSVFFHNFTKGLWFIRTGGLSRCASETVDSSGHFLIP